MTSEIYQFLENFKADLEAEFPKLPILIENKGDLAYETENALSKQGIYVLIRIPEMLNTGNSKKDKLAISIPTLMLQVSENVTVNRAKMNLSNSNIWGTSAQDTSIILTKFILKKYSEVFSLISIDNDFSDNLMISSINFETTLVLSM